MYPPSKATEPTLLDQAKKFFLLGMEYHHKELYEDSEHFFLLSLNILPDRLSTLTNLIAVLLKLGKLEKASCLLNRALTLYPNDEKLYLNQGLLLHIQKNYQLAVLSFDKAIKLMPDFAEAFYNRGIVLQEIKLLDQALISYNKAIELKPDYAEAFYNRGIVLQELKRLEQALTSYNKAIELKPNYAEAFNNRGIVQKDLKQFNKAIESYSRAIYFKHDYAEAFLNIGNVFKEIKDLDQALLSYNKAIELKPDFAEAFYNRGIVLQELRLLDQALISYNKAIELKHDYAEAFNNCGVIYQDLKQFKKAIENYDKAIELKFDYSEAYLNKSLVLLLTGDFFDGFLKYEWRWKFEETSKVAIKQLFNNPLWLGNESLSNKTILIWSEQGLGDSIQFCRYCSLVKSLGARVLLEAPKPLLSLFESLEGVDILIEKGKPLPDFDYHCPLMSLPLAFKTVLSSIPISKHYLKSRPDKLKLWSLKIGEKSKPRIGLVWSGSTIHKNDANRSIALADVMKHLPPNYEYFSLQKDVRESDIAILDKSPIAHFGEMINDFNDTSALCDLMDLVISVDTSVAHLEGALGKTTWVLLPYVPDWRWLLDRVDSPWYESMKLYRQSEDRKYAPVLDRLASDMVEVLL